MKNILPLLVVGVLVLGGIGAGAISFDKTTEDVKLKVCKNQILFDDDEIDQFQINFNFPWIIGPYPWSWGPWVSDANTSVAQSFIPTKNVLSRVDILIGRNRTTTLPIIVTIKEELSGPNIAMAKKNAGDVANESFNWTEFDFSDKRIKAGVPYYIISYTTNITDNWYAWAGNNSNIYLNGSMYYSIDDGETWTENESMDMCFLTYGYDNDPPDKPTITGKTNGKTKKDYEYTITGTDPEGDDLFVNIYWGDNTSTGPLGPYDGSYNITKVHSWEEEGDYTITAVARDPLGWGPEGTLEVTMPKNKAYNVNSIFQRYLQNHPLLFQILKQLLSI